MQRGGNDFGSPWQEAWLVPHLLKTCLSEGLAGWAAHCISDDSEHNSEFTPNNIVPCLVLEFLDVAA